MISKPDSIPDAGTLSNGINILRMKIFMCDVLIDEEPESEPTGKLPESKVELFLLLKLA